MKAILLQGNSQYDVLNTTTTFFSKAMSSYGIENIICNLNIVSAQEYLEIVKTFKPDFTISNNPICYLYDGITHHEYTNIPHIVRLGDHPYYHVGERALKNPNAKTVFTIAPQQIYVSAFEKLNVNRYSILNISPSTERFNIPFDNKIFPMVFFGSIMDPYKKVDELREKSENLYNLVNQFIQVIINKLSTELQLLEESIEIYFENFLKENLPLPESEIINISRTLFPIIDSFYRNFTRIIILQEFAETGLEMWIFSDGDAHQYFSKYPNVIIKPSVSYLDCINIIAQSKVALNVTPFFKTTHERISNALFNSTLLCSNEMEDLTTNHPNIKQSSLFYNLNSINHISETIKEIIQNKEKYNRMIELGREIATNNFSYEKYMSSLVDLYRNVI
ncbi:glycosyltransferase [Ureibacillus thermosphaericus]|uniref:glycosyltransferase n=1 Tax=Ureibacillus thermosphaericus TaxID=51173 RepID=UPI000310EBA2|nr:hypothetical protein [Ureibacillus thermosphaericus]